MDFCELLDLLDGMKLNKIIKPITFLDHMSDKLMGIFIGAIVELILMVGKLILFLEGFGFDNEFRLA